MSSKATSLRPRRILSVNNYHYRRGGAEVVYFEHERIFSDLGWETANFAMRHPQNASSPYEDYFVEEIELGHTYSIRKKVISAARVIYSFEAKRKLSALLDGFAADIAHLHCIYHHLSPSILHTLSKRNIPTVMTAHDLKLACPAYRMLNHTGICERCKTGNLLNTVRYRCIHGSFALSSLIALESTVHRLMNIYKNHLNMIVTPSAFFRRKFVEWGWNGAQIAHIPNFIDASEYIPNAGGTSFLYFGRLSSEKGVATLISAAARADLSLDIAGTGPQEQELRRLTENLGARVTFHGFVTGNRLKSLIQSARAVVLPSEWYENAPISILEAFASGKPVIGADIGGIPEMIDVEQTGYLFPSGDVGALAETLNTVRDLTNSQLQDFARLGRSTVERRYSRRVYTEKMLSLYGKLIDSPAARRK